MNATLEIREEGSYKVKRMRGHDYLYRVYYEKGKQKLKIIGNLDELEPDNPHLVKYKTITASKDIVDVVEKYYSGRLDKEKTQMRIAEILG